MAKHIKNKFPVNNYRKPPHEPLPLLSHAFIHADGRIEITLCSTGKQQDDLMPKNQSVRYGLLHISASYEPYNICGLRKLLTVKVHQPWKTTMERDAELTKEADVFERMERDAKNLDVKQVPPTKSGDMI
jgi:hypothetical protein